MILGRFVEQVQVRINISYDNSIKIPYAQFKVYSNLINKCFELKFIQIKQKKLIGITQIMIYLLGSHAYMGQ